MKKKTKIGILIFIVTFLVAIALLFCFTNQDKEDKNIHNGQPENKETNTDSKHDNNNLNEKENASQEGDEVMKNQKIKLSINDHELIATLNDNSSARALIEELKKEPIIINMSDYANMEKVGDLGINLPRNDENITTSAGDLILYQGHNFVIYYDTNNWSLTRLGKIDNISGQELKNILGNGDVTVKLSLD